LLENFRSVSLSFPFTLLPIFSLSFVHSFFSLTFPLPFAFLFVSALFLLSLSFHLQPDPQVVIGFQNRIEDFFDQFSDIVNWKIKGLQRNTPELKEWKCEEVKKNWVRSLGNLTNLTQLDLDIIVELNTDPVVYVARTKTALWPISGEEISPSQVVVMARAMKEAVR
jgi:hypothetical protein